MLKSSVLAILASAAGLALGYPEVVAARQPEVTIITLSPAPTLAPTTTPCPVVTLVGNCPTCTATQIACIKMSTVYDNLPGCPSPAPTSIVDYFCDRPCPPQSCITSYIYPDRPSTSWVDATAPTAV